MRINLSDLMRSAWRRFRSEGNIFTFSVCLRLAWMEAKGQKGYAFPLEAERGAITAYLMKMVRLVRAGLADIHEQHKVDILRAALLRSVDAQGIAVLDGKTVGLLKFAVRNAA